MNNLDDLEKQPCAWCGVMLAYPKLIAFSKTNQNKVCVSCAFKKMDRNPFLAIKPIKRNE